MNKKIKADPETFKVADGKLFLFFNGEMMGKPMNTLMPWNQNEAVLSAQAEKNWAGLAAR